MNTHRMEHRCAPTRISLNQAAVRRRVSRSLPRPKPVASRHGYRMNDEHQENDLMHITDAVPTTEAIPATEQRTTPPLTFPVDDAELASAFEQAVRDAGAAQTLAAEAEQRAAAAADAFCSDPTADTHGSAAALRQLAVNAGERARQSAERAAVLGAEQLRRQRVARLTELEPGASRDRLLSRAFEEVRELGTDLHARMEQASARLLELLHEQNTAAREADQLASDLGEWRRDLRAVTLAEVNEWLATRVPAAYPPRRWTLPVIGFVHGPVRFTAHFGNDYDGNLVARVSAITYSAPEPRHQS
jgi:hypothetical protein